MRISDDQAFKVCDIVETDFTGKPTRHIVSARYKVRSQSGVVYDVIPKVKGSGEGDRLGRLDHGWFKKVGHISFGDFGMIDFGESK